MELVRPALQHEEAYHAFAAEWAQAGEEIITSAAQLDGMTYSMWLETQAMLEREETCPQGFVPATTLFLIENGELLGAVNIRHRLNAHLLAAGGHIGYGVRPSARGKGCAKEMLRLALPVAKSLGIDRALLTCDKSNTASARTILSCGGVLEDEVLYEGKQVQRYWITC